MKIAVIGATGFVGLPIVNEALERGHEITAISRHSDKLSQNVKLRPQQVDVNDTETLAKILRGNDVVIHSYAPPRGESVQSRIEQQTRATKSIIAAVKAAGVKRLLAVGGAGTCEIAPGVQLMDSYIMPKTWEGGAKSTAMIKTLLKAEPDLDWVFISPAQYLEPGPRTGKYRTGDDNLIFDELRGRSYITVTDYAVAMLDEAERPAHSRRRFTVGT